MNVAFHDALNFAWKVHLVEAGFAKPSILETYESERKQVAENLLEFDAKYAELFSTRKSTVGESLSTHGTNTNQKKSPENDFVKAFKSSCEFTSGYGMVYSSNVFNWGAGHPAQSPLFNPKGSKLVPGRVFPPSTVTRLADANVVKLEQEVPMNGAFRIYIFAGRLEATRDSLFDFASNISKKGSFYSVYERQDIGNVSHFERHNPHSKFFTLSVIFAFNRSAIDTLKLPSLLKSYHHHIYADDVPDLRVLGAKAAAHAKVGFDPEHGGVAVVRPDGHIACTLQLVKGSGTVDALNEYFGTFASKHIGTKELQAQL